MKGQFTRRFKERPVLYWSDLIFTLLPAIAWAAAVHARPRVMQLHCIQEPSSCLRENVFFMDRVAIGLVNPRANELSFITQDLSGVLALLVPWAWSLALLFRRQVSFRGTLAALGTDLVIFLQCSAWNGLATESARLLIQRPRPFVFENPAILGADPSNYTSFFSGHTSFSAVAGASLICALVGRHAPRWLLTLCLITSASLIFLTGLFRVLAARHFVTDVLAGSLSGILIALSVGYLHRPSKPQYHHQSSP